MTMVSNPSTQAPERWRFIVGLLAILIACTVSNTAYADLTTGLVAHYCFDDASKIGKDCSGNGRDGTVYGSVSLANPPGATFNPSSSDNSGYIQAAPAINKNSSFTVFAWVKPTYIETIPSSAAPHTIVMERASGIDTCGSASYYNYALQIYTGKIGFFVYTTDCKSTLLFANSLAKLNQSIFLTAVYNNVAGTMSIYVDGKLDNTVAVGKTLHTTSNAVLRISKNSDIAKQPWHGQLDNIRIYDTALTDAEIATLAGGVVTTTPILTISDKALAFKDTPVEKQDTTQTVTLSNSGTGDLKLGAVTLGGAAADDYVLVSNTCDNKTLAPDPAPTTCSIGVAFKPKIAGKRNATITIASNIPDESISLTGLAQTVDLSLSVVKSPRLLAAGTTDTYQFQIENLGDMPATGVTFKTDDPSILLPPPAPQKLTQGCVALNKIITCDIGTITPNQKKLFNLVLKAPPVKLPFLQAKISQKFSVSTKEKEFLVQQVNNQVEVTTQTYVAGKGLDWEFQAKRLAQETPTKALPGCTNKPFSLVNATTGTFNINGSPRVIGSQMPIKYIFVLMLENRSFDSYFGRFPAYLKDVLHKTAQNDLRVKPFVDDLSSDGVDVPGTPLDVLIDKNPARAAQVINDLTPNANTQQDAPYNPSVAGNPPKSKNEKHFWQHQSGFFYSAQNITGVCVSDTAHDWWSAHLQWNRGAMDGFYQSNHNYWEGASANVGKTGALPLDGERAMLYYDDRDIPFYYWLADRFAIGDRYFSSLLGPTWVNRDYLYAGTSRGLVSNSSELFYSSSLYSIYNQNWLYGNGSEYVGPYSLQTAIPPAKFKGGVALNYIADGMKTVDLPIPAASKKTALQIAYWVRERNIKTFAPPRISAWSGKAIDNNKRVFDPTLDLRAYFSPTGKLLKPLTPDATKAFGFEKALELESVNQQYQLIAPVNFIDPDQIEDVNGEDEHPPGLPGMGQKFTYRVIKALMKYPEIWKRSALFITYDEHGGFYDHASPPPACEPDGYTQPDYRGRYGDGINALKQSCLLDGEPIATGGGCIDNSDKKYGGAFNRYGVRVPMIVVSPWVKQNYDANSKKYYGYVSHQTYDHTSILRFIEARWDLPALTRRDANADPMMDFFNFTDSAAKLAGTGKYKGWGIESLPTSFHSQSGNIPSSNIENYGKTGRDLLGCNKLFPPAQNIVDIGDIAANPYPARDWSDGIAPPASYLSDKSTKGIAEANVRR